MLDVDIRNVDADEVPTGNVAFLRERSRRCGWRQAAGTAAVLAVLTGCSSLTSLTGGGGDSTPTPASAPTTSAPAPTTSASAAPASSGPSFTSRVKSFFSGDSSNLTTAAAPGAPAVPEIDCPSVEYRQGAATLPVNSPGSENAALGLRYLASFVQTARECVVRGADLVIKVGVQGRIVVGPAGGPGPIAIPLRYALVREGLQPRTLWTKLFMVPVTIPDNQLNLPWLHIEEEMTVPLPSNGEIDRYVIYIGFDPDSAAAAAPKPAKPAPKSRTPRAKS
jgi:hypothetical protein